MQVVELLPDRAPELVHEPLRVDEVERADTVADEARGRAHQRQVGLDLARCIRALDLDHDLLPGRQRRPVHLSDRGGRDRRLVEREERALDREPELGVDHLLDRRERNRRDVVLELAELRDDVERDDVRPGREQLAELDERRAELVEHLTQPASAVRGAILLDAAPAPLDDVPEAVACRDTPDLGQTAERTLLRLHGHVLSVARARDVELSGLEQLQSMLELGDPEREVVHLLALDQAQLDDQPGDQLLALEPCVLGVAAPAGERVAHGGAQLVAIEPDEPRQVVGEIVGGLGGQRRPAETGQKRRLDPAATGTCTVVLLRHATRSSRTGGGMTTGLRTGPDRR